MRKKKILFITGLSKKEKIVFLSILSLISFVSSFQDSFSNKTLNAKLQWAYRYIKRYNLSIRRISHKGQAIPETKEIIKNKFFDEIINKSKEVGIIEDEDYRVLNMDETPCYLEMGFDTTIDFKGKKEIEIETFGRAYYRITVLLTIAGDGTKLPLLVIVKEEERKIIENNLRKLDYGKNKK